MENIKYLTAFERMQDFARRHKQHNINDVYRQMQKKSQSFHKLGVPVQVFYPSTDIITISPFLGVEYLKGNIKENSLFNQADEKLLYALEHFWGLHLFGAWRNTLGIYRIDDDIFDDVIKSAIPDDTPSSIFKNLPEWSVYVQFAHHIGFGADENQAVTIDGFWATFDCRIDNKKPKLVLNIVPNLTYVDDDTLDTLSYRQLQPICFYLDDDLTIKESAEKHFKESERFNPDPLAVHRLAQTDYKMLTHFLSCLLLLCVQEPDVSLITGEPISRGDLHRPKHSVNKKTGAFIVPSSPHFYDIGARLGGEVRKYKAMLDDETRQNRPHTKRPHIRRGHWHGYWHGTGQAKEFKVKWQPAIFVNFN